MVNGPLKKERKPKDKPLRQVEKEDVDIKIAPTEQYFFQMYMKKKEETEVEATRVNERVPSAKLSQR